MDLLIGVDGSPRSRHAILIGSRDTSMWGRSLSPSTGHDLIDHAPCPVLVVR